MAFIEIYFENGTFGCRCSSDKLKEPVELNEYEAEALSIINKALPCDAEIKVERRTDNYLTILVGEFGDFCRLKATDRATWVSLDLWGTTNELKNDVRLQSVKNKNQRHWKIPLSCVDELEQYSDFILSAYNTGLNIREYKNTDTK